MPYWDIVTRSFRIPWSYKYLWLLALFAGEGGAGFRFSYGYPQGGGNGNRNVAATQQQVATWLADHVALVAAIAVLWLALVVAVFILAAICEAALIRGSAEHDADRPFRLAQAWRAGVNKMWVIVRFRLLLIALALPAVVIAGAVVLGFALSVVAHLVLLAVLLALIGFLVVLAIIVYAIYLNFLDRLGSRAAILEERGAWHSVVRGHNLLVKRFARTLLIWLISIAVAIAVGVVAAIGLLVVAAPLFITGAIALAGVSALWSVVVLFALVWLAIALPVVGYAAAQDSTYWTVAFRRLDAEYPA